MELFKHCWWDRGRKNWNAFINYGTSSQSLKCFHLKHLTHTKESYHTSPFYNACLLVRLWMICMICKSLTFFDNQPLSSTLARNTYIRGNNDEPFSVSKSLSAWMDQPFQCSICSSSFMQIEHLLRHIQMLIWRKNFYVSIVVTKLMKLLY